LKQQTQSPAEPPSALIAMSSPAAQHQRTEDAPTRSKIWHSDGSIVLQVDNTQFRVHWSLLALNSSFFRDMRGLPRPPNQPSIEGCPIVELHDAVIDVEYLLTALYTPSVHCSIACRSQR
jgi:hypothetical protein